MMMIQVMVLREVRCNDVLRILITEGHQEKCTRAMSGGELTVKSESAACWRKETLEKEEVRHINQNELISISVSAYIC